MATQEDLRRICLSLPAVTEDPNGFRFFVDGKQFVWAWLERTEPKGPRRPNRDVVAVRVADELAKQALLMFDAGVFFSEPHYDGYPAILVRLPAIDLDLLRDVLTDGWRSRAPRRLVRAFEA
jgi:hypothetical protein